MCLSHVLTIHSLLIAEMSPSKHVEEDTVLYARSLYCSDLIMKHKQLQFILVCSVPYTDITISHKDRLMHFNTIHTNLLAFCYSDICIILRDNYKYLPCNIIHAAQ